MRAKSFVTVVFAGMVFWITSSAWSEPIKPLIYYSKVEKGLGVDSRFISGAQIWREEETKNGK